LWVIGYSSKTLAKSTRYSYSDLEGDLVSLRRDMPPDNKGAQYVETPHNEGIGSPSCAVRCLLLSPMESQNITSHPMRLEA
jgi:hypothetical protein